MIEARIDDQSGAAKINASGNIFDLVAGSSFIVHDLYCQLNKKSPKAAEIYRLLMQEALRDDSVTWETKDDFTGREGPADCPLEPCINRTHPLSLRQLPQRGSQVARQ